MEKSVNALTPIKKNNHGVCVLVQNHKKGAKGCTVIAIATNSTPASFT